MHPCESCSMRTLDEISYAFVYHIRKITRKIEELPYPTLPCPTLPYLTLRTLLYPTLPYFPLPYLTLPYPSLPYSTLPYLCACDTKIQMIFTPVAYSWSISARCRNKFVYTLAGNDDHETNRNTQCLICSKWISRREHRGNPHDLQSSGAWVLELKTHVAAYTTDLSWIPTAIYSTHRSLVFLTDRVDAVSDISAELKTHNIIPIVVRRSASRCDGSTYLIC